MLTVWLLLLLAAGHAFQTCPSICTCKWKNGKRWVECRNKGQISIPDSIDTETQVLDFSGNNLQILPREVFSRHGLLNLQKLKLAYCNIGQIDPTAFRGLTNLVELDLSGNLLTSVPTPTFSDIPYLREFALNNNPLQKIESNAFEMIPQIVSLDLSGCQIKKISSRGLYNVEKIERLQLHNNKLEEIKDRIIMSLQSLQSITLHDNPWNCDCKLRSLHDWLVRSNVPMTDQPRCQQPRRLQGTRFADLATEDFACVPDILPGTRYAEANLGGSASLQCRTMSVPPGRVAWYRAGREILNSSLEDDGQRKFTILESGDAEKTSTLIVNKSEEGDAGEYICWAENRAGKAETNYTLRIGYFAGTGSLRPGEIAGIAITLILLVLVIVVVILVLVLRLKPLLLRGKKLGREGSEVSPQQSKGVTLTNPVQKPPRLTELTYPTGDGGAVLVNGNGNTFLASNSGGSNGYGSNNGYAAHNGYTNGISNGYINPDVIPIQSQQQLARPPSVEDRIEPAGFLVESLKPMKTKNKTSPWAEEVEQNLANGFTLSQQNLANGFTLSQQNLANGFTLSQQNLANGLPMNQLNHMPNITTNRLSEPRSLESEFSNGVNHRYQNFPPPVASVGVNSSTYSRLESDSLYPSSIYTTRALEPEAGVPPLSWRLSYTSSLKNNNTTTSSNPPSSSNSVLHSNTSSPTLRFRDLRNLEPGGLANGGLDNSLGVSSRVFDRGCADGRAAEDSSLSDAAAYSASSSSVPDYGYREEQAAYTGRGSLNFTAGLPADMSNSGLQSDWGYLNTGYLNSGYQPSSSYLWSEHQPVAGGQSSEISSSQSYPRYPVDYGLPAGALARVQVNPLSTLEEEEDEYTNLHPSIQALDVLQHRGKNKNSLAFDGGRNPGTAEHEQEPNQR